jgi:hypothetical protein
MNSGTKKASWYLAIPPITLASIIPCTRKLVKGERLFCQIPCLKSHAEWIDVEPRLIGMIEDELSQLSIHILHGLAGKPNRRYFFHFALCDFKPPQNSRQGIAGLECCPFNPQTLWE